MKRLPTHLLVTLVVLGIALLWTGTSYSDRPNQLGRASGSAELIVGRYACGGFQRGLNFQATEGLVSPQNLDIFVDQEEVSSERCLASAAEVMENATALGCTVSFRSFVCNGPRDRMVSIMNELMTSVILLEL
jgi:hypothetical protein